jgi:hypothetical protein
MDYTILSIVACGAFAVGFGVCAVLTGNDKDDLSEDTHRLNFLQARNAHVTCVDVGDKMIYGVAQKHPEFMLIGSPAPTIRQAIDSAMLSAVDVRARQEPAHAKV